MSWQLGSLAVLGAGLLAGFAWYEHARPDSRTVALVGVLAALGALGRIAFAALPNVKPTTDIVLIAGFALGGAPGYVVGALSALTSNFFFGQGPWTPWQMAGWGAVGIAGTLLARVTRGRISRLPLALLCLPIGFAFTALQDVGGWVTYSDHSLAQLGVYVGKGTAFDLIHAGGCFVFALAFGPSLIAALRRFCLRLEFRWIDPPTTAGGPLAAGLIAALTAATLLSPTLASPARAAARSAPAARPTEHARPTAKPSSRVHAAELRHATPLAYLLHAENRDGGFPMAPGQASDPLASAWAAIALAADHIDLAQPIRKGASSTSSYLKRTLRGHTDPGSLERVILARHIGCPADFRAAAARRPTAACSARRPTAASSARRPTAASSARRPTAASSARPPTAASSARPPTAAGAAAANSDRPDRSAAIDCSARDLATRLRRAIRANGSVADQSNLTAFAILALRAAGLAPPARTVAWLARQQDRDGGFNYSTRGASSDVDDTAAGIEALAGSESMRPMSRYSQMGSKRAHVGSTYAHAGSKYTRVLKRAITFIRANQNVDGGFPSDVGGPSNAQSTAFAVQALIATHTRPGRVHRHGSRNPLQYLQSLIQPSGAVDYARGNRQTPVWVTAQAELALSGHPL